MACLGPAPRMGRRCLEGRSLAGACARLSLQSRTVLRPRFPALSDHPVLPVPGFPVRPVAARTSPFTSMDRELLSRSVGSGLCTQRVVGTLTNEWTAMSPGFGVTQACQPWALGVPDDIMGLFPTRRSSGAKALGTFLGAGALAASTWMGMHCEPHGSTGGLTGRDIRGRLVSGSPAELDPEAQREEVTQPRRQGPSRGHPGMAGPLGGSLPSNPGFSPTSGFRVPSRPGVKSLSHLVKDSCTPMPG